MVGSWDSFLLQALGEAIMWPCEMLNLPQASPENMSCVHVPNPEKRLIKKREHDSSWTRGMREELWDLGNHGLPIPEAGLPVLGLHCFSVSKSIEWLDVVANAFNSST